MMKIKNKNVLICVENLPVPQDRRVWLEAKSLAREGYQISVISIRRREQSSFEILDGIWIYRYLHPPVTKGVFSYLIEFGYCWIMTFYLTLKIWKQRGIDIFHICNPPDTFFVIGRFLKLFGKKMVYDQHDLCPEMYLCKFGERKDMFYRLLLLLEKMTYKAADVVLSTSGSYQQIAQKRGNVRPERNWIVRTGPDDKFLSPGESVPHLKEGFSFMAVSLGVIGFQDGIDYLLKVIYYFINSLGRRDTLFVIIGNGDALAEMKQLGHQLGITKYIRFTGWLDHDQALHYLRTADLGLVSEPRNDYTDRSTHNKVLEYMAVGIPVVSFDLTEAKYSAGESAVFAEGNDPEDFARKINLLLDNELKRKAMGKIGRQRIEQQFSWQHTQKNLLSAYRSVFSDTDHL